VFGLLLELFVELGVKAFVVEVACLLMGEFCKLDRQLNTRRNSSSVSEWKAPLLFRISDNIIGVIIMIYHIKNNSV